MRANSLYQKASIIPSVKSKGLLGDLKPYVKNPLNYLNNKQRIHGDIYRFRVAYRSLVVINHPEYIRHILQDNHRNYRKNLAYRKLKLLLGNGLFTNEGDSWLKHRRLAQPAFHKERLGLYMETMVQAADKMVSIWKKENAPIPILSEMTQITLEIISKCLLGLEFKHGGNIVEQNLPYALQFMIKRVTSALNAPISFPLPSHQKFKLAVRNLNNLIATIIENKRTAGQRENDLLSMLMETEDAVTGEKMSDKQLRDEILTFFLAGHETSAVSLAWAMYLIGNNAEVYLKLKEEAQAVFSKEISPIQALQELKYTRMVVQETMRLASPIWVMGREALEDDRFNNYGIKKGQSIIFSPFLIHRHPDFWEDPETFNPERFSDYSENKKHPFAYFPFGAGPRQCIGNNFAMAELQLILATIFKSIDFELTTLDHPGYQFSLTLRPEKEIYIKIK